MDVINITIEDANYNYLVFENNSQISSKITEMGTQSEKIFFIYDTNIPFSCIESLTCRCKLKSIILGYNIPESEKNISALTKIISDLIENKADRNSLFIIVGGGVLGNVAGLACGMLFRGVRFVHVPSTIMACSDSVLSLKQGINMNNTKNILGMYYAPYSVMVSPELFASLSLRDTKAGYVEFIKNMLIVIPEEISSFLQSNIDLSNLTYSDIGRLISLSAYAKLKLIEHDKYEKSMGLLLEYGHTVGHALEMLFPNDIRHGEGVAVGMLVAANLSVDLNLGNSEITMRIREMLEKIDIFSSLKPIKELYPTIDENRFRCLLKKDNKRGYIRCSDDEIAMVMLSDFAKPLMCDNQYITPVNVDLVIKKVCEIWEREI